MKYLVPVVVLLLLFSSCSEKEEITFDDSETVSFTKLDDVLLNEEDWENFFSNINDGIESLSTKEILGRKTVTSSLKDAAKQIGYTWIGGVSIKDHNGSKTIAGLDIFSFEENIFIFLEKKQGKQDLKTIWSIEDFLYIPESFSSFGFQEAKSNIMDGYNKEKNIWGIFDWDSPLIKPDVYISAEKVIIIDIDTSTMTLDDNVNGEYKVFIDAAFLE